MNIRRFCNAKTVVGVGIILLLGAASWLSAAGFDDSTRASAQVRQGFAIAPVALNLNGKNPDLVGYGSYLVNAVAGCNDCHTSDATLIYAPGGNPSFGQPAKINPSNYLGGGRDFGPYATLDHLYSRNLTPDKTGLPVGGMSFSTFLNVLRTGADIDNIHPNCSATVKTGCLPPPFAGGLLQIMPWAAYGKMSDYDLLAIYTYLSAVPCVTGPADKTNELHNECQ
jgi:hypothetical protein